VVAICATFASIKPFKSCLIVGYIILATDFI